MWNVFKVNKKDNRTSVFDVGLEALITVFEVSHSDVTVFAVNFVSCRNCFNESVIRGVFRTLSHIQCFCKKFDQRGFDRVLNLRLLMTITG